MIGAQELNKLTIDAIHQAQDERLVRETARLVEETAKAEKILTQVPDKARKAALTGETSAIVMSLTPEDWSSEERLPKSLAAESLVGTAKLVFAQLVKADLNPTLVEIGGKWGVVIGWKISG